MTVIFFVIGIVVGAMLAATLEALREIKARNPDYQHNRLQNFLLALKQARNKLFSKL